MIDVEGDVVDDDHDDDGSGGGGGDGGGGDDLEEKTRVPNWISQFRSLGLPSSS